MLGFSLCCFLSFTVWVTPENGIAKRQLRHSSVLTQDSRSLQTVSLLSSPAVLQILCIGPLPHQHTPTTRLTRRPTNDARSRPKLQLGQHEHLRTRPPHHHARPPATAP